MHVISYYPVPTALFNCILLLIAVSCLAWPMLFAAALRERRYRHELERRLGIR